MTSDDEQIALARDIARRFMLGAQRPATVATTATLCPGAPPNRSKVASVAASNVSQSKKGI